MSDSLLPYYERELDAIKRLAAEFADAHPKIAGRLRVSADAIDDPHVARLLEGAAFLAARVHHRLDDEFPELTDALLGLLYPHYLAPVPSCMVVQFDCQPDLINPARLAAGTSIDTEPVHGEELRYRTTAPVMLWPVEVENVRLSGPPIVAPANPFAAGAAGVLRITLKCVSPEVTFTQLGIERLRFFLRGPTNQALALYELLGAHAISIAFADNAVDPSPAIVPASAIEPVGFSPDEALLPWSARGFAGFRLLTEYFAFPDKFLFFDITRMDSKTLLSSREPAGDIHLSRSLAAGAGAHCRSGVAGTRLHPSRQSFPAALRADHAQPRRTLNTGWFRMRGARAQLRSGAWSGSGRLSRTGRSDPGDPSTGWSRVTQRQAAQAASTTWRGGRRHPAFRARRYSWHRMTRRSTRPSRPMRCCQSMRSASTETCRPTCRSAAVTRDCG